ncbi:hebe [Drosophila busckii]|uniref:Hebe n=1 Tax=Drosophila busckii TaxID=30019 RepID=A0A0M3QVI5_DROBS|nr:cytadherence high molecular weight protein 1 [Drosophila busckii]XP_017839665.1 cytadherence high molecular weight protein 1 [Drosophila busckii]ALC42443.1 hebe [Drosophila busckii]
MADTINKPSIQIRNGLPSPLSDKSPSPATKLLISHGKPNFTIARSPKPEDNANPLSPQPNVNNNYSAFKSANVSVNSGNSFVVGTKFNGVFKPTPVTASWAASNGNGNGQADANNEAAKVVLRRAKPADAPAQAEDEDQQVPEFIRRQRRIQERLAKENVLDFENRRSGYFTHVMISPDSPNRTSFMETMASPAVVPSLEMPVPAKIEEEEPQHEKEPEPEPKQEQPIEAPVTTNGHVEDAEAQEVAQAIEEVIKAVAGEDDGSKPEPEPAAAAEPETVAATEAAAVAETAAEPTPEPVVESAALAVEAHVEVLTATQEQEKQPESVAEPEPVQQNGHAAENGHDEGVTISHTNGHASDEPSIPAPDPSGALGVNFEPKTVVSFSQELGGGENNYPDTVKVLKDAPPADAADAELQEMSKLKFDIKSDGENEVQVTPVLREE